VLGGRVIAGLLVAVGIVTCSCSASPSSRIGGVGTTAPIAPSASPASATGLENTTTSLEPTTTPLPQLGANYESIVRPANAALAAYKQAFAALPALKRPAQLAAIAAPLIAAMDAADSHLLRVIWPPQIEQDIRGLVTADKAYEELLANVGYQTPSSVDTWNAQQTMDEGQQAAAASLVHADLGLPPLPSPSAS
jgi:hypothetical protein